LGTVSVGAQVQRNGIKPIKWKLNIYNIDICNSVITNALKMSVTCEELHGYHQEDVSKIQAIDFTKLIISNEEEIK
jgi:hypothetical protein